MAESTDDDKSQRRALGPIFMAAGALTALFAAWSLADLVLLEHGVQAWRLALRVTGVLLGLSIVLFGRREYLRYR